jgi:hypothetical protein
MKFIESLAFVRSNDAKIAECVSVVSEHVLFQWHTHGNKTPYLTMQLAINGGVDEKGLFGAPGKTMSGVSKAVALAFSGIKLGKRDPQADTDALAKAATEAGMRTKAQVAADAKAKRDAKPTKPAESKTSTEYDPVTNALVLASGAALKLTSEEAMALYKTLVALRSADKSVVDVDAIEVTVLELA